MTLLPLMVAAVWLAVRPSPGLLLLAATLPMYYLPDLKPALFDCPESNCHGKTVFSGTVVRRARKTI